MAKISLKNIAKRTKLSKGKNSKRPVMTIFLSLFVLIITISAYSIYSYTNVNNQNTPGMIITEGTQQDALTEGVIEIDPSVIENIPSFGEDQGQMMILPETGTQETDKVTVTGSVSLKVTPGNCDISKVSKFFVVQSLAGYIYKPLSIGYTLIKSVSWELPPKFSVYQGGSAGLGTVPKQYFSWYSMKTQNWVYYLDSSRNKVYLGMVLSNSLSYPMGGKTASSDVSIQIECKAPTVPTPPKTITPIPGKSITPNPNYTKTPTPTPTIKPTCAPSPNCRFP